MQARMRGPVTVAVTSSTGNHGQGVAWAAAQLGIQSDIFLPERCNVTKKAMIAALGARLYEGGVDIDDAKERARSHAARAGHIFVDDGESLDVMEGAGTAGLEAAQGLPNIDIAFVPMGSGSLASGCAAAIKGLQRDARVIAVQAEGAPAMVESFRARRPVERPIQTIADGLVSLIALVDDVMLVSDDELLAGVRTLVEASHVLVEPSGAAALAAAWKRRAHVGGKTILLVLTGSNIASPVLQRALSTPPLFMTGED
jgi:threonine dehydratase